MLSIDYYESNSLKRKEVSKILINNNFSVKTFDNIKDLDFENDKIKLFDLDNKTSFTNFTKLFLDSKNKENIIILIKDSQHEEIKFLKKHSFSNLILLPINSINELPKDINIILEKAGLKTERKNILISLLNDFKQIISKIDDNDELNLEKSVKDLNIKNLDKIKNRINLLEKTIKQYQDNRHNFSGFLSQFPLFEVLKFIQQFFSKGVLYINSGSIKGEIIFKAGDIVYANYNDKIKSQKALEFLSLLRNGTFSFSELITKNFKVDTVLLNTSINKLIENSYTTYKWYRLNVNNIPNDKIYLSVSIKNLLKNNLNSNDFEILCYVIEHSQVQSILSLNKLSLVDSYETLINLRRKGVLEVSI